MGVNVYLQTERGDVHDRVLDPHKHLKHLFEQRYDDLVLLRYVDVYGDTVFNFLQAADVLRDVIGLRARANDAQVSSLLDRVEALVRSALRNRHLYIRFSGD